MVSSLNLDMTHYFHVNVFIFLFQVAKCFINSSINQSVIDVYACFNIVLSGAGASASSS